MSDLHKAWVPSWEAVFREDVGKYIQSKFGNKLLVGENSSTQILQEGLDIQHQKTLFKGLFNDHCDQQKSNQPVY